MLKKKKKNLDFCPCVDWFVQFICLVLCQLGLCAGSWMGCDRAGRRVWGQLSQILCVLLFRGPGKALSQHRGELMGVGCAVLQAWLEILSEMGQIELLCSFAPCP